MIKWNFRSGRLSGRRRRRRRRRATKFLRRNSLSFSFSANRSAKAIIN